MVRSMNNFQISQKYQRKMSSFSDIRVKLLGGFYLENQTNNISRLSFVFEGGSRRNFACRGG